MKLTRQIQSEPLSGAKMRLLYCLSALVLFLLGSVPALQAQTVPVATASASQQLLASFTNPVVGHMGTNSLGDLFYVNSDYSGGAILYRLVRGTTTPVQLASGFSGARNVYVDSSNNLYVPNAYGGDILEIPFVNGTYATALTVSGSIPACGNYKPSTTCFQFGSVGAVGGYYYQPVDLGLDAAGNAYVLNAYANGNCAGNCILKFTKNNDTSGGYTPSLVVSNITAQAYGAQIAVDPAGDVFYENGTKLYVISAGTTSAVAFGTAIPSPAGVSTDAQGNLYVTNSASPYNIFEFPVVGTQVQTGTQFSVLNTYSGNSVAVDTLGELYYIGYSGGNTLNLARINSIPLGSAAVGTASTSAATSVNFNFAVNTTIGGITSTGAGFTYTAGSCTVGSAYAAGSSCTVNVKYTPTAAGRQTGAVTLTNASGATLAAALLSGIGNGAVQTNDPGTLTAIGSGLKKPSAIAVDSAGNVYIVDSTQNAVLRYAGGTGTPTMLGTGLSNPTSLALDNAGNLYIADSGNGRVVQVPNVNGTLTNSAQSVVIGSLGTSLGITFDFAGNLYIADTAKKSVTEVLSIGGVPRGANTLALGSFTSPTAVATDLNGNLLVADFGGNSVSRISYIGKAQTTVSSAFSKPTGVATDASGSVYVADNGNSRLVKVPLEGTAYNTNDQYLVGAGVAVPYGVALDGAANLYVVDQTNATASLINRTAGALALGRVQIPQSSSAQNATVGSAGTSALTFGTPLYVATSTTPAYFTVTSPSGNGCAAAGSLQPGFACILSAVFSPTTTGNFTDLLTFNSNAVNSATRSITLTGRGVDLAIDTLTLTQTSGAANFGSPVTIQAAVTSTVAGTPMGTVAFTVDGNTQGTATAINSNGSTTITLNGLTGGAHTICGSYTGDDNYRPSNSCITITVNKVATTTTLLITAVGTTPLTSSVTQSVTLTATVKPGATTPPTGTVTFTVGTQVLGTAPVTASGTSFVATLTTTALPAGTDTVVATYNSDVNYLSSTGSGTIIVTYPTVLITPQNSTATVSKVGTVSLPIVVTALGGFNGTVVLQCKGLPANTVCAFNPNNILLATDAPQAVTVQITTGKTPVITQPVVGSFGSTQRITLLTLLLLAPISFWGRRRVTSALQRHALTLLVLLSIGSAATFFAGCGGSGLFGDTPVGTSNVQIVATATGNAAYAYGTSYASGCTVTPATSTTAGVTCSETAAISLVVQ